MRIETLVLFLWFLRLFKPEWILTYYVPGITFIRGLPTGILYLSFAYFIFTEKNKIVIDKPYLLFFLSYFLSTIFAYNTGIARTALRGMTDSLIFYVLAISLIKNDKDVVRLFNLYLLSLIFYAIFGIIYKGRVPFHVVLNEEDAIGPLMGIGVPFSFYLAFIYGRVSYSRFLVTILAIAGVVVSFARGAFIGLCVGVIFLWHKSSRKATATGLLLLFALILIISASYIRTGGVSATGGSYWEEISTISGSYDQDEGRLFLWERALMMFASNPITGVGPANYGFVILKFTTNEELEARGARASEVYGRVVHNAYFQILAELGAFGFISFIVVIICFWKKNREVQKAYKNHLAGSGGENMSERELSRRLSRYYYQSLSVQGALLVYLANCMFYDLLYVNWLPDMLILNSLIYLRFKKFSLEAKAEISEPS